MELRTKEYKFNDGERKVEYVISIHQRVLEYHEAVVLMSLLCGVIKNEERI